MANKKQKTNRYTIKWGDEIFDVSAATYYDAIDQAKEVLVTQGHRKSTIVAADFELLKTV
jgi:hypothetical protein